MALAGVAQLFEQPNEAGRTALVAVGLSQRYQLLRETDLLSDSLDRAVSSTTVFRPSDGATSLICIGFPIPLAFPDFSGLFVQMTSVAGGAPLNTNLSGFALSNGTSSALLVRLTPAAESRRLSFRTIFLEQWKTLIDAQLAGSRASRKGDPILTWEMFPLSITGLDPALRYLRITQELNIDVPAWPDYDASITYWILLSLDSGGKLEGFVARSGFWVDDGVKHDKIAAELAPQVEAGAGVLTVQLAAQLAPFRAFTFTDLYYLPGDQTAGSPAGVISGTTVDDVTIVLQS